MPVNGWVVVRTYSFPGEAHVACSALAAAGIDAEVIDRHVIALDWLYSNALGGVKVLVRAADAAEARDVLELTAVPLEDPPHEQPAGIPEADRCPRCGSGDLAPATTGRRLAALSWLVTNVPLFPMRRRARCGQCGLLVG